MADLCVMAGWLVLRRPLVAPISVALLVALVVAALDWQTHRDAARRKACLAASIAADQRAAAPLIASIRQAPRPGALSAMPVASATDPALVLGPWQTHMSAAGIAQALAAWLPRKYLTDVNASPGPVVGEWTVRAHDTLRQGVSLQVTIKPIGELANVTGLVGTPPVTGC